MPYLCVKQKVKNFDVWYDVFSSHEESNKEAGFRDLKLLRDTDDENTIVCFFYVDDNEFARDFTEAPQVSEAQHESGIIGIPEVLFLEEI